MENPVITTIIPTYKRPQLLKRALSSALNQTFKQIQVIVYDNASGDETKKVVQEFIKNDPRVKYHCHPHNIGMMGNYQYALKEVQTPYFSLLSDDDVILPWFYEEALPRLQNCPKAAFFAGSTIIMSEKGKVIRVPLDLWKREGLFSSEEGLLEMIGKYPVPTGILFRRQVVDTVPIDMDNNLTWDCDFLVQIAARYSFITSQHPCSIFLQHESSYSNSQSYDLWKNAFTRISERLEKLILLPSALKIAAIKAFNSDLRAINRAFVLLSLSKKYSESCRYAAMFHENYGPSSMSWLLLALTRACRYFPSTLFFLRAVNRIRRLTMKKSKHPYESYAEWLK